MCYVEVAVFIDLRPSPPIPTHPQQWPPPVLNIAPPSGRDEDPMPCELFGGVEMLWRVDAHPRVEVRQRVEMRLE